MSNPRLSAAETTAKEWCCPRPSRQMMPRCCGVTGVEGAAMSLIHLSMSGSSIPPLVLML
eukprot:3492135-Prymnesium_polylepis.2